MKLVLTIDFDNKKLSKEQVARCLNLLSCDIEQGHSSGFFSLDKDKQENHHWDLTIIDLG